jgi:3-methylcrotonyl-CoA carboxylase alpha subunit
MRLKVGGQVHDVVRSGADAFDVDGVRLQAGVIGLGGPRFDGRSESGRQKVFVVRDGDRVLAQVGDRSYTLAVVSRASAASSDDGRTLGGLEAPMPGRVTRVNVSVGDAVTRGQELIVVEAMKMENALVAPEAGTVKSLGVKVGDMVAPGPALIVIEGAKP